MRFLKLSALRGINLSVGEATRSLSRDRANGFGASVTPLGGGITQLAPLFTRSAVYIRTFCLTRWPRVSCGLRDGVEASRVSSIEWPVLGAWPSNRESSLSGAWVPLEKWHFQVRQTNQTTRNLVHLAGEQMREGRAPLGWWHGDIRDR